MKEKQYIGISNHLLSNKREGKEILGFLSKKKKITFFFPLSNLHTLSKKKRRRKNRFFYLQRNGKETVQVQTNEFELCFFLLFFRSLFFYLFIEKKMYKSHVTSFSVTY